MKIIKKIFVFQKVSASLFSKWIENSSPKKSKYKNQKGKLPVGFCFVMHWQSWSHANWPHESYN